METLCKEASQLKYSAHQRAQTEATLIRLCSPALSTDNAAIIRRIDELEAQLMLLKANGITVSSSPEKAEPKVPEAESKPVIKTEPVSIEAPVQENSDDIPFDDIPPEPIVPFAEEAPTAPIKPIVKEPIDTGIVTESDNAVPFAAWENTLNQLARINRPIHAMLIGSSAYRAGNTVFIKAKNTAFPQMFKQQTHVESITQALSSATGEKLKPMIYNDG